MIGRVLLADAPQLGRISLAAAVILSNFLSTLFSFGTYVSHATDFVDSRNARVIREMLKILYLRQQHRRGHCA